MSKALSPAVAALVQALKSLPGVGNKNAQRMALHLLERDPISARNLAEALNQALAKVRRCESCQNLCEMELCGICDSPRRDESVVCVVESPMDVLAVEQTSEYKGRYFVLRGRLSPIDGLGPDEIGIDKLQRRLKHSNVKELILATNPTVEGEATAHYIAEIARHLSIPVTRIAHGIPLGGELGSTDSGTLSHALIGRKPYA